MKRFELRNWTITSVRMLLLASFAILTANCSQSEDEESSPAFSLTVIAEEGGTAASNKRPIGREKPFRSLPCPMKITVWEHGTRVMRCFRRVPNTNLKCQPAT